MGDYVDIAGHSTWMDDTGGDKPPVLLLHGGLGGSETMFGMLQPLLAESHRVVMFDRKGHGRTKDTDAPFSYAAMADETAAVIEHLGLGPAQVVGYSDGGIVLLHLALKRPELLAAMVLLSANFHHNGVHPGTEEGMDEAVAPDGMLAAMYAGQSPDGADHWPVVAAKGLQMMMAEPTFTTDDLRAITTPTLVLAGDDDLFPLSHTCALYESLPNAQLAIVPGTSHLHVMEKAPVVARVIQDYLAAPAGAVRMMPVLRG
jgi:pimeloyl-ACP methyl ester carboxylesterase